MTDQPDQSDPLLAGVDALLAAVRAGQVLPSPTERLRLRQAAGLTSAAVAQALRTRPATVESWEAGRSEPNGAKFEAYRRLLEGLAAKFPVDPDPARGSDAAAPVAAVTPVAQVAAVIPGAVGPMVPEGPAPVVVPRPARAAAPVGPGVARRAVLSGPAKSPGSAPVAAEAAAGADARFANGPLLVLDGEATAYGVGGLVLECPAKSIPALVEWTLEQARIGAPRLHRSGRDDDPLVVLTAAAAERFGLPLELADRRGLRLAESHPVVRRLLKSKWQLTRRGFGPWTRIYQPVDGGRRRCVQLAILPWNALDVRDWGKEFTAAVANDSVHPAEIARALGAYASLVMTPRGGGATCGTALMESLRPPTHAVQDERTGTWVAGALPGSLPVAVDPAPPEAPEEHPLVVGLYPRAHKRAPDQVVSEEAYDWVRDPELLTDAECALPMCVGIDVNMAFAAGANRLTVGLGEAVHVSRPVFDRKIPGEWLYDLSVIPLDPRLPSPFTPSGATPTGPAWYETRTVAYAHELIDTLRLDIRLTAIEGWLRPNPQQLSRLGIAVPPAPWESGDEVVMERLGLGEPTAERLRFLRSVPRFDNGPYLDPWYTRLRDAYLAVMAELGVVPGMEPADYLAAMARHKELDPALTAVLSAVKSTVKGGVGKLRERPQGHRHELGEPWAALRRPTWRPDIRAAVISSTRVNMHRKLLALALKADLWPMAVLSDCVIYPSAGPSPLDFLPFTPDGKPLPGGFRLGVSPGMVKLEGAQSFLWAVELMDQQLNPARHVKGTGHDAVLDDGE